MGLVRVQCLLQVPQSSAVLLVTFKPTMAFYTWHCLQTLAPKPSSETWPFVKAEVEHITRMAVHYVSIAHVNLNLLVNISPFEVLPETFLPLEKSPACQQHPASHGQLQPHVQLCVDFLLGLLHMAPLSNSPEQAQSTLHAAQASVPVNNSEATDAKQDSSSTVPCAIAQGLSAVQHGSLGRLQSNTLSRVDVRAAAVLSVKMLLLAQPVTAQTQLADRNGLLIHTLTVLLKALDPETANAPARTQLEAEEKRDVQALMQPAMVLFQQAVLQVPEEGQYRDTGLWSTYEVIYRIMRCRSLTAWAGCQFCKQGMHQAQPLYSAWFTCCNAPYAVAVLMSKNTWHVLHVTDLSCIPLLHPSAAYLLNACLCQASAPQHIRTDMVISHITPHVYVKS